MSGIFNKTFLKNSLSTFYNKAVKKIKNKKYKGEIDGFKNEILKTIDSLKEEKDISMNNLKGIIKEMKEKFKGCVDSYTGNDIDQKLLHSSICSIANEIGSISFNKDIDDELERLHINIHKKMRPWNQNLKSWLTKNTETDGNLAKYAALVGMSYRFLSDLRKQLTYEQEDSDTTLKYARKAVSDKYPHPGFEDIESEKIQIFNMDRSGNPIFDEKDVQQTEMKFGDCWFLSTLKSLALKNPEVLLKCFKSYPENGVWTPKWGDISVRVYEIDIIGEAQRKKIINIKPNKFLKGVNYFDPKKGSKKVLPAWPRILELAAQSAFYGFDDMNNSKVKASIGDGYQEIFALRILGACNEKSKIISFSSDDKLSESMKKLNKLVSITRDYTNWSITTASPTNAGHAVAVAGFNAEIEEPVFYYFDQHWKPGHKVKEYKIFDGGQQRIFTISYFTF